MKSKPFNQHPALVAIREATGRLNKREAERQKVKRREARSGLCTNCGASTVRGECRLCGGTT